MKRSDYKKLVKLRDKTKDQNRRLIIEGQMRQWRKEWEKSFKDSLSMDDYIALSFYKALDLRESKYRKKNAGHTMHWEECFERVVKQKYAFVLALAAFWANDFRSWADSVLGDM